MKKNIFLQKLKPDCGSACIANVLKHYGKLIDIRKIRAYTKRTGEYSGLELIQLAESMDLSCRGAVAENKKIPDNIPRPFIAHLLSDNESAYVVVNKNTANNVCMFDPKLGKQKLSMEEFQKRWSGVFFIISPKPDFSKSKEHRTKFSRFFPLLKQHKAVCIKIVLASIVLSLLGILSAFFFRFLIDEVLNAELNNSLKTFCIGFLTVIVFRTILELARNQLLMVMGYKIDAILVNKYFEHVMRLPMKFFTNRKTGEILARLNDTNTIRQVISVTALSVILDSIMLLLGGGFLISLGSDLIAIAIIPVILSSILVWLYAKPYQHKIRRRAVADAEQHSCIVERLNAIGTVKALAAEDTAVENAEFRIINAIRQGINLSSFSNIQNSLQSIISRSGMLAIYWLGSLRILDGSMSLGQLISFVILSRYFLEPLSRLLTLQPQLQKAIVAAERLSEIFDIKTEEEIDKGSIELKAIQGDIEIKNISFSYDERVKNLDSINMKINPGEKIAFVGTSGSGKTTLAKLLMKFYEAQEGDIFIDGMNIKDIKTISYRKQIGFVPQEVLLLSGSISENINFGSDNNDLRRIIAAAELSEASGFINNLPDRYETLVGEHGATLSGGERQRIAIARILLKNPSLLILDEATAGLDNVSEKAIIKTLNTITDGRTSIIIAHRLSTITECDKIFVFEKGRIVESGSHEHLLEKNGAYSKLWNAQNNDEEAVA